MSRSIRCLVFFSLITVLADPLFSAQACIDYRQWFCPVSRTELTNEVGDLEVIDSIAYVAGAYGAFQVFDVSDPEAPALLGSTTTAPNGFYLTVAGDIALLGCSFSGLQILSVGDPGAPALMTTVITPDNARGSVVIGNYAYVGCSNAGLSVVDISNPSSPFIVTTLPLGAYAQEVSRYGDYVLISCLNGSLAIVDVSVATAPFIANTIATPGVITKLVFRENLGYAASDDADLQIYDFTNPTAPVVIGSYLLAGVARSVAVLDNFVFLGSWETQMIWQFGGVRVFDATDPTAPVKIGSIEMAWGVASMAIDGDYLVVGDHREGMNILWAADPYSPYEAMALPIPGADRVAVADPMICVSSTYSGLYVLERGFMPEPEVVATYEPAAGNPADVAILADYALLACSYDGLHIVDITGTGELPLFASAPTTGSARAIAVVGNMVYLTCNYHTLTIIDLTDPANPDVKAAIDDDGWNWAICANEELAVIAGNQLVVVDITDAQQPDILANITLPNTAIGVDLYGNIACVAWEQALWFYDLSNPSAPALIYSLSTPGESQDVVVEGDMAYVSDGYGGVQVIYLNPEGDPYWYGSFDSDGYAMGIFADDDFIYIADSQGFLRMVQSQCPITGAAVDETIDMTDDPFGLRGFPNPSAGPVSLSFILPAGGNVSVAIIDPTGRLVREMNLEGLAAGANQIFWDGRDREGTLCGPGVYLARLYTGGRTSTGKLLIVGR